MTARTGWRLWLLSSVVWFAAAAVHPERRVISLAICVIFGIIALRMRSAHT